MSSLFIRLDLDEDVNVLVADLLSVRGFDVLTTRDASQLQATGVFRKLVLIKLKPLIFRSHNRDLHKNLSVPQATDDEQLLYAVSQQRALVTHNRSDFETLVRAYLDTERMHYGVILAVRRSPEAIAQRLLAILNQVTANEMQNQIRYI
jgi:hypothetical protein